MNKCAAWHYDLTPWGGTVCLPCPGTGAFYDEVDDKWYCHRDAGELVKLGEEADA